VNECSVPDCSRLNGCKRNRTERLNSCSKNSSTSRVLLPMYLTLQQKSLANSLLSRTALSYYKILERNDRNATPCRHWQQSQPISIRILLNTIQWRRTTMINIRFPCWSPLCFSYCRRCGCCWAPISNRSHMSYQALPTTYFPTADPARLL